MATKVQKRIQEAYGACYHLCENDRQAEAWLTRALDAARRGEKQHRKIPSGYKLPIADAARFFAVKWFLQEPCGVGTAADFCAIREDSLYAQGAAAQIVRFKGLEAWKAVCERFSDVATLDYVREFTK